MSFERRELDVIRQRVGLVDYVGQYVKLTRRGREYVGLSPFKTEKTPSFTVAPGKGFFHDFASGEHGDVIRFAMLKHGWSFPQAVRELSDDAAIGELSQREKDEIAGRERLAQAKREKAAAEEAARKRDEARALWAQCQNYSTSRVMDYLHSRGIDVDILDGIPPTIRFHPELTYWEEDENGDMQDLGAYPVMLSAIQGADGKVCAVHRTFLDPDGDGKADVKNAKKMSKGYFGGAIRFGPPAETLALAEGIETALSVLCAFRAQGRDISVWAAGSLGNIAGSAAGRAWDHPYRFGVKVPSHSPDMRRPGIVLPRKVRRVILLADNDMDPLIAKAFMRRATTRFQKANGVRVSVAWPPPGKDWNDVLQDGLEAGENVEDGEEKA